MYCIIHCSMHSIGHVGCIFTLVAFMLYTMHSHTTHCTAHGYMMYCRPVICECTDGRSNAESREGECVVSTSLYTLLSEVYPPGWPRQYRAYTEERKMALLGQTVQEIHTTLTRLLRTLTAKYSLLIKKLPQSKLHCV